MEVRIAIYLKGLLSTYEIRRTDDTTAYAYLIQNKGTMKPPDFIRLTKHQDQWVSAYPDVAVIKELVSAIENRFSEN